jgi:hypothetical protein
MKKRYGDIASLFQKIAAKKNSSSSSIPSNDAMDHDGDIGPSVWTTGDSRISGGGDIVPLVNLIICVMLINWEGHVNTFLELCM